MALRWLTAIIGIPLVLTAVWIGGAVWLLLLSLIACLGLYEWSARLPLTPAERLFLLLASLMPLSLVFGNYLLHSLFLWVLLLLLYLVLRSRQSQRAELERLASLFPWLLFGVVYIPLFMAVGGVLRQSESGLLWVLFSLLVTWSNDTGAFFMGLWLRGPKIAPSISPNKTWSGSLGGILGACILAAIVSYYRPFDWMLPLPLTVGTALCLAIAGQIGDLFESFWKRSSGIKDSGTMIPGHGGVLDRFDSLLIVWPVLYLITTGVSQGHP